MGSAPATERLDARVDNSPAVSHYGVRGDPTTALCGARLIGVRVSDTHEPHCVLCTVLLAITPEAGCE